MQDLGYYKKEFLKEFYQQSDEEAFFGDIKDENFEKLPVKHYETFFQPNSEEKIKIPSKNDLKSKNLGKIVDMENKDFHRAELKRYDTIFEPTDLDHKSKEKSNISNPSNRSLLRDSTIFSQISNQKFERRKTTFGQGLISDRSNNDFDIEDTSQININYIKINRDNSSIKTNRTHVESPLKYRKNYALEKIVKQAAIEKDKLRERLKKIDNTINDIKLRANSRSISRSYSIKKSTSLSRSIEDYSETTSISPNKPTHLVMREGNPVLINKANEKNKKFPKINKRKIIKSIETSQNSKDDTIM